MGSVGVKKTPYPEQEAAIQRMVAEPTWSCLDGSLMSAGKTLMHVEQGLRMQASVVVIVGPLGTVDGWRNTLFHQSDGVHTLRHITSKKDGWQHYVDLLDRKPGWYFVGREFFRGNAIDVKKVHADLGIVDEIQLYSNRKSAGWRKLMQFQPAYKVACSGTWFGNKVENMWSVARWLWPDVTDVSFWRWAHTWLTTAHDRFAGQIVTGEKMPGRFAESLPCYIRIEPTLVDLLEAEDRWVDLSPQQRKMYDKLEKDLFVQTESDVLMTEVPIATRTRLRQITMAVCDAESWTEIVDGEEVVRQRVWFPADAKSTKFDELLRFVEENPDEQLLIGSDSAEWVTLAASRLPNSFAWKGGVKQEHRNEAKARFESGELKYIVAQLAAAAEGVDGIQLGCNTIVWASRSDSNYINEQFLKRVHRIGQDRPVRQVFLKARDTIDDAQHLALVNKQLQINAALARGEVLDMTVSAA